MKLERLRLLALTGTIAALVGLHTPAWSDRDIVYAAQYYRWSGRYEHDSPHVAANQTLADLGPSHLYRINSDGSGRTRLTSGTGEDKSPCWSPDGKQVLFVREKPRRFSTDSVLCLIGQHGGAVKRLLASVDAGQYAWSPDGRYIAAYGSDSTDNGYSVYVIDLHTGRKRKLLPSNAGFAWSPDSRRLFLCAFYGNTAICHIWSSQDKTLRLVNTRTPLVHPIWLDNRTILGDLSYEEDTSHGVSEESSDTVRMISVDGKEQRRIRLRSTSGRADDSMEYAERYWHRIPGHESLLLLETGYGMSDGRHYSCYLIDLKRGTTTALKTGRLIGLSPDGNRYAVADANWVGPYKRGGRRAGALQIVSFRTGKSQAITSPLVSISGGDWRLPQP